jgi:hypothetical protein
MADKKRRFGRIRPTSLGPLAGPVSGSRWRRPARAADVRAEAGCRAVATQKEAEILAGGWNDPDAALIPFKAYADEWLRERQLRPKTRQLYEGLLRLHLYPMFGSLAVGEVREWHVRSWRARMLDAGPGASTVAKAYTGANLRELIERMGHASTKAAMVYLHSMADRDRRIADALGALARPELERRRPGDDDDDHEPPLAGARV